MRPGLFGPQPTLQLTLVRARLNWCTGVVWTGALEWFGNLSEPLEICLDSSEIQTGFQRGSDRFPEVQFSAVNPQELVYHDVRYYFVIKVVKV